MAHRDDPEPQPENADDENLLCGDISHVRVFEALKRTKIVSLHDVIDMLARGKDALLVIDNFGKIQMDDIVEKLREKYYSDDRLIECDLELSDRVLDSLKSSNSGTLQTYIDKLERENNPPRPIYRPLKIRELARTQNVNGGWGDSIDLTAAALLTFIREGHTARKGDYRAQVKKALDWLKANARGLDADLDYVVRRVVAEHDESALPPAPDLPERVATLDDMRLVALIEGEATVPKSLYGDPVALAWRAPGKPAFTQ